MNHEERIASLSEMAYYVTQQNGTERPFTGILNKEYRQGDYFCISIQNTTMQESTVSLTHRTG